VPSNNFWYGFMLVAFLVFGIFLVTKLLARARTKSTVTPARGAK
jgi:prolipoprotein diacylglyceryltransferase